MIRHLSTALVGAGACVLSLLVPMAPAAAQHDGKYAATDPAEAGPDYAQQGEYLGQNVAGQYVGLQVVALDAGTFEGVLYEGGLPGAGWNREHSKHAVSGQREPDDLVTLSNERFVIILSADRATVEDAEGRQDGSLRSIHRVSPTLGAAPPANAIVLFADGEAQYLKGASVNDDGHLNVGVTTEIPVADFQMHLEFRTPFMPQARGQARSNSGVYIQRRYEVQILDSFGLEGVANECGGLYRQQPPNVNMCLPPLQWQTYDLYFTAARWDESGNKTAPAKLTVFHNGEPIHAGYEIKTKTGAGQPESPEPLPILLQNHGNPVVFRNIWLVPGTPHHPQTHSLGVPRAPARYPCQPLSFRYRSSSCRF